MHQLPYYVFAVFGIAVVYALLIFIRATKAKKILMILIPWMALQAILATTGFYENTSSLPPRFIFALLPPVLLIAVLFLSVNGRRFVAAINIPHLTLLHLLRIPVELTLFWLFLAKGIPKVMTFEGQNLDILAGVTALPIWWITRKGNHQVLLLGWNIASLALLLNIVVTAILAAPTPFQQLGFGQPNVAVFWFPFIWLPAVLVPMVLFSHIASIILLIKKWRVIRLKRIY